MKLHSRSAFALLALIRIDSPTLAIRDGDWSLLMNADRSRVELYEIKKDPMQLRNVAEKNAEPKSDVPAFGSTRKRKESLRE